MAQYRVKRAYYSEGIGPWRVGEIINIDPPVADWVNSDSPGTLVVYRALGRPPKNRMAKAPKGK